jgi:uncharacterized protein YlxW (UPF0749 family)
MKAPVSRDASMSLLSDLMTDTLDAGYAEAAARRGGPRTPRPRAALVAGVVLVGFLLSVAVLDVRDRALGAGSAREALVDEVVRRTEAADTSASELVRLRSEINRARRDALALGGGTTATDLDALELSSGAVPVTGPGLVVTVDDPPQPDDGTEDPVKAEERILDRDLQSIVNSLWAAGAEAISVNDQRLTALSAIRSADIAILVDYRPLLPPYVVRAIGDPRALEPDFVSSRGGRDMRLLAENYGFRFEVARSDALRIPAASGLSLRSARPPLPAPVPRPDPYATLGSTTGPADGEAP